MFIFNFRNNEKQFNETPVNNYKLINHDTSCDITSLAQRECDFKQSCYLNGTNILRDDAWVDVEKYTTIRYTCSKMSGS